MKRTAAILATSLTGVCAAGEVAPIGHSSVAAVLQALRADSNATFAAQAGWTVVASPESDHAVEWFFTPDGHPAHPAVIKRTVLERNGVSVIDLAALCHVSQRDCDRLLDDFKQVSAQPEAPSLAERILFDVGIDLHDHAVRVNRLLTEEGKAAEIRMDDVFKLVIVPTLDETGGMMVWTAMYEFDGSDYVLLSQPQFAVPGDGTAQLELSSASGESFGFWITPLVAER